MLSVVMLTVVIIVIVLVSTLETRINVVQMIVFYQRNVCSGPSYPICNTRLQHYYFCTKLSNWVCSWSNGGLKE
jgi:hypothetical protein